MLSSLQSPSGHLSSPSSLSSHTHSGKSFVLFFVTMMYIFFTFITEKAERQIPPQFGGQRGFISVNFVQFVLNSINLETKQVELEAASFYTHATIPLETFHVLRPTQFLTLEFSSTMS